MAVALTEMTLDLAAVKRRQQATWASGDYAAVATLIVPVAERLLDLADVPAGGRVLDVATGSGNAALAAARFGCEVTGIDYVESLLERARERAAVERLPVDFALGDVENIEYESGSFDAVVSVFGSMFAPDHARAAGEMLRVTRPGGTVALASWTPDGFIGDLFRTVAAFAPPPKSLRSPMLWGTPAHLDEIFRSEVAWTHTTETFTFRFPSAEAFAEYFTTFYGPTLKVAETLGHRAAEFSDAIVELVGRRNRLAGDGAVAIPAAYLASVGERR
jgi:ubiquinone/menaquinone biosynthesis C-methylase UbiE